MANPCTMRAQVVRARLKTLGYSQARLAEHCGFELRTLQRWIAGQRVSVDDAERVARELGLGTTECFDGVPERHFDTAFTSIRPLLGWASKRLGPLGSALGVVLDNFEFIDDQVSFAPHPGSGFVQRRSIAPGYGSTFAVLALTPSVPTQHFKMSVQAAPRFRFHSGDIRVADGSAHLTEYFFTREMRAPLDDRGSLQMWAWLYPRMPELVVQSAEDFELSEPDLQVGRNLFDLSSPELAHAVCFRPSAMHLRSAGLPPAFDRVVGSRDTPGSDVTPR